MLGIDWSEHRLTLRRLLMSVNTALMISNEGSAQSTLIPTGVLDTCGTPWLANISSNFRKNRNDACEIIRGNMMHEKKPEAKNS
jgi:hypothetical protein